MTEKKIKHKYNARYAEIVKRTEPVRKKKRQQAKQTRKKNR